MGWVHCKSFGFACPHFADVFEGREALEGLQPAPVVVGVDEVVEAGFKSPIAVIVIAFDGSFLDRAVHPFDLAIGPRMLDLGEPVLDLIFFAPHVEHVRHAGRCRTIGV